VIKKNSILILLFGLLFVVNLSAQERQKIEGKEDKADDSVKQNINQSTNTESPPPDQIVETKKTETVDKAGRVQKITTIEFF